MSYDIIQSIKSSLATIEGGVDSDTRAVAGNGGSKRISIKGGVFRKMAGGKEVATIEDRNMNVIFVKMAHNPSRMFYPSAWVEGEKISPTCWSTDSKTPDAEVKHAVASTCDKCPMSVKGSGIDGRGTACRLSWRTAVVLPHDPSGDVMQLVLPAASVFGKEEGGKWPFRAYVQMLANNNISAGRVVTKMQFDTKSSSPKLFFSAVEAVGGDLVSTIQAQSKVPAAEAAVKLTVFQQDESESDSDSDVEPAPALAPELSSQDAVSDQASPDFIGPPKPTVREGKKAQEKGDLPDVVARWSKK